MAEPDAPSTPPPTPLISVVIPCYNSEAWVGHAIRSVLDQDFRDVEIVVIDDGSKDRSAEVLRGFGDRIRYETQPNAGACVARNRGTALARGTFVLFLDADDGLAGPFLSSLAAEAAADVDVVVGSHVIEDETGRQYARRTWPVLPDQARLMEYNVAEPLQTGAFLWRKSFVEAHGGWDITLPIAQDTDFAIRMMAARPRFRIVTRPDAYVVWRAVGGPDRITTKMSARKRDTLLDVFTRHAPTIRALGSTRAAEALAGRFYGLARIAFVCGDGRVGNAALAQARALGLRRQGGGALHRLATRLLGLRRKTRLTMKAYDLLRRPVAGRPYPYNLQEG